MKIIILTTLSYLLLSSFAFASEDMAMNKYIPVIIEVA